MRSNKRYNSDGRIDLRTISSKGTTKEQMESLISELNGYAIEVIYMDINDGSATFIGRNSKGGILTSEGKVVNLIKNLRKVERLENKINNIRRKYGVEQYETKPLYTLINETSSKVGKYTGYENYIATLNKILTKREDTGRNAIEEAGFNVEKLRRIKYNSFDNQREMLENRGINVSIYYNEDGTINPKKERELHRLFCEQILEEFDSYIENESFFTWMQDTYGESYREVYGIMTEEEKSEDYGEYVKSKSKKIKDLKDAEERDLYELTDRELDEISKSIKRGRR